MADSESLQSYSPLLGASATQIPIQRRLGCTRRRLVIGVPCGLIVAILVGVLWYFADNGAFTKVSRDVRIVNGTVTEPNTKLSFPVNRPTTLDGQSRVQRLIGLFLKTKHVPQIDASLHVFVLAVYLDRTDARRELARYRKGAPHQHQQDAEFKDFVEVVASGKMTATFEYRMVMSPPGSQMHDHWLGNLVELWTGWGVAPDRITSLKRCFSDWFLHTGFHNHDDIFIEVNSRTHFSKAIDNGKPLEPPACTDPIFGRAIITHEYYENGNLAADLLPTLWNSEYDETPF